MKKIFLLIFALSIIGVSCQEEFEVGETNTAAFAGQWFYQLRLSDGSVYYDLDATMYGYEFEQPFLTYNSAANKTNEVWFDDQDLMFPLKSKFTLVGTPESFSADLAVNERVLSGFDPTDVPEEDQVDGKKVVIEMNDGDYYLAKILEGKIIKGAATVWLDIQKAKTDSIYVKYAFFGGNFNFTVKRNIKIDTVNNVVVRDTSFIYTRDTDFFDVLDPADTLIMSGHRWTGWEVDFL